MTDHPKNKNKKTILLNILAVWIALFLGCASHKAVDVKPTEFKRITDIIISEDSASLLLTIKGNQSLIYTAIKQVDPAGVLFHFPDTALSITKRVYNPPNNEIIRSIKAAEIVEDKTITSSIFIALKKDTPYALTPAEGGIQISLPKTDARSKAVKPQKKLAEKKLQPKLTRKSVPAAARLKTITAKPTKNNVIIYVKTDGTIRDYKSFTMDNPGRIVFDMYNIKSPYEKEQKIAVKSKWVKQMRYFGHPDKVRLVLQTHKDYLSKYSALPTDTGLLIHVGNIAVTSNKANQTFLDGNPATKQVKLAWDKVPNATSYNVYLSDSPGVTKRSGLKIPNIKNPYVVTDLKRGTACYFVVTAVNESGESNESEEFSFTVGE